MEKILKTQNDLLLYKINVPRMQSLMARKKVADSQFCLVFI